MSSTDRLLDVIRHKTQIWDGSACGAASLWRQGCLAWARTGLAISALLATSGCRYGEMYDQPKFEPYKSTSFFSDGSSARPSVPGTVAQSGGIGRDGSAQYLTGRAADNSFIKELPIEARGKNLSEVLTRGQNRYGIYCAPCHGLDGAGKGPIVLRGFSPPPQLYEAKVVNQPLGYYFDVITNGHGAMYGYGARIHNPADRWAIAGYLRALQLSHNAPADLPGFSRDDREKLQSAASPSQAPSHTDAGHSSETAK